MYRIIEAGTIIIRQLADEIGLHKVITEPDGTRKTTRNRPNVLCAWGAKEIESGHAWR